MVPPEIVFPISSQPENDLSSMLSINQSINQFISICIIPYSAIYIHYNILNTIRHKLSICMRAQKFICVVFATISKTNNCTVNCTQAYPLVQVSGLGFRYHDM